MTQTGRPARRTWRRFRAGVDRNRLANGLRNRVDPARVSRWAVLDGQKGSGPTALDPGT